MENTLIGETAGKVWHELNEKGEKSVAQLRKETGVDAFSLNAAIGWLAREDKVVLSKARNSVKVSLKDGE